MKLFENYSFKIHQEMKLFVQNIVSLMLSFVRVYLPRITFCGVAALGAWTRDSKGRDLTINFINYLEKVNIFNRYYNIISKRV